ncbi:MAG: DUF167 domain-containing protein [Methanobacteriota archaeon]|nr:MAG: DUF167 domain-containing protein [Euryarchaeota archaeon]
MSAKGFIKAVAGGCHIVVIASPGAAKTAMEGVDPWRHALRIRVGAAAEHGRANDELIRFLSEALSLKTSDVDIVHGDRSRRKVVFVPVPAEDVARMLEVD